ncbi:MAG: sodium-dependent transporter [Bacteroidales bacterium]|jgi:NSS family neurotransmitter:Na+ symporter|nr:sodium-dependent transporter [Bacteroidales bacterium]MCK9498083.1 sodium-dependent transporter [Bacteroidales bacterium]MDY0313573.1 sodium-dependent transporter [Bacteroidales bacterium]NLB86955.1 sodium-dependent transporter [Bacteroidales bacterium]NLB87032.1 sodium-dependent transporter [Bacteroidales bacterium]
MSNQKRDSFSGKFGVIVAAVGSAVGLGNIWRFPYIAGENGGGAFLLIYIFFVIIIGIPVMMSEFVIGRRSGSNAMGSFRKLAPKTSWWLVGLMGIIAAFVILAFYSTVSGWTLEYIFQAFKNSFSGKTHGQLSNDFNNFTASSFHPILWQIVVMAITAFIVFRGVSKGIEKASKILMPLLLVLIIAVCVRSLTLPGASKGLEFLFKPDFSKITFKVVLMALGQAAFSLSIGMGALITYGSYIRKDTPLLGTSFQVAAADTIIAILSGVMVFPALFALGGESTGGPGLVFITLPGIFQSMPGGYVFGILFFVLIFLAALTSTISVLEVVVAYFKEDFKISRLKATLIATISISILGIFCTLSFGPLKNVKLFDKTIFGLADYVSANILLTFGALLIVIFTGWYLGKSKFIDEVKLSCKVNPIVLNSIVFIIKWVAPIAIGAVAIGAFFIKDLM